MSIPINFAAQRMLALYHQMTTPAQRREHAAQGVTALIRAGHDYVSPLMGQLAMGHAEYQQPAGPLALPGAGHRFKFRNPPSEGYPAGNLTLPELYGGEIHTNPPSQVVPYTGNMYWFDRKRELNYFDTTLSHTFASGAGNPQILDIVDIPGGSGVKQRVGRNATIKNICIRGRFESEISITANIGSSRHPQKTLFIWVCQDEQANGSTSPYSDVIDSTDMSVGHRVIENNARYTVLDMCQVDLCMPMPFGTGVGSITFETNVNQPFMCMFNCDVKCGWASATGEVPRTNNIFLMYGLDAAGIDINVANDSAVVEAQVRVRYV